ncbi:MAG TPA: hypothetical protein VHD15_02505 [Hyphomicrobiales bacterium]|nr:hypothetical protein [Hyphomicrobiales bacterium]
MRLRLLPVVILAAVLLLGETVWLVLSAGDRAVPAEAPRVVRDIDPTFRPVVAAGDPATAEVDPHAAYDGNLMPADPVTTGSIGTEAPKTPVAAAPKTEPVQGVRPVPAAAAASLPKDAGLDDSPAERKLIEDLHQRGSSLDDRAKALDLRENLLAAAQKRLDQRIGELKALGLAANADGSGPSGQPAAGSPAAQRLDNLVAVYAGMRAKDAAKIFDQLDMGVLEQIARRMKPRQLSEILGLMDTKTADRLTMILAGRNGPAAPTGIDSLPKIEGHPTVP